MNALPLSLQTLPKHVAPGTENKKADAAAKGTTIDFAQLIGSVSPAAPTEPQATATQQQEEIQEKMENLLSTLQELPQDNLTPEQQEMMQAIMQLLAHQLQPENARGTEVVAENVLVNNSFQPTPIVEEPLQKEMVPTAPAPEKLSSSPQEQAKLATLIEEAVEVLQKLVEATPEKNPISGGIVDSEKLVQVFGQLASMAKEFGIEQQKNETKTAAVQVQQLEQVLKQATGLKQEPIDLVRPKEIQQPVANQVSRNIAEVQSSAEEMVPKLQEAPASTAPVEQSQLPAATGTEAVKGNPAPQRPEANVPQATVRMSNLVEELGEVLRGSFRLNGDGDSKQIRISIFPEHLGHMDVKLTSIDGKIIAQLFTSSLAAKEALDQQASLLRSSMMQQGIMVEKIEITQQSSQQSFGQQNAHPDQRSSQQQKQGASARSRNGYQRIEEDAAEIVRRQSNDGSIMKVDYTI
ncbi:flagellar hook-length control protein FliK [Planomicrobium sp. CPCC 101110]|uniref:flagellar hook-length control protein FliK n=1 Tax=Planomicrobium sp. CPCC 101110 TaxID=2599619 RepID=UPI0011B6C4F6|nr:flagellar hook-length control protein FliK [Planomicrobium sp. CPCC 101110]TWT27829.1 flagellar hook-length control protein FliK [Planomicrobium sp. CPCC 101110]